jgi:hypothetical protein
MSIRDDLVDLHKQATTERSHHYVAECCERAIHEIDRLRATLGAIARSPPSITPEETKTLARRALGLER